MGENKTNESLKGERPEGHHDFMDLDGKDTQGDHVIFPILRQITEDNLRLIGTGFFIGNFGLFLSAKHVLRDCFDNHNNQKYPICICQFFPNNQYRFRNILWCSSHHISDVAIGLVEPENEVSLNPVLQLTTSPPALRDTVATYAYPKTKILKNDIGQTFNFNAAFYDGEIMEYLPNGRDQTMLPGPCYQTSMVIHSGASGGPVAGKPGRVFGINSTGFEGDNISYLSRIDEVLHLQLPHFQLPNGQEENSCCLIELAKAGWIDLQ